MKTFFGFTTGLLTGTLIGALGYAAALLLNEDLRDFVEDQAEDLKKHRASLR